MKKENVARAKEIDNQIDDLEYFIDNVLARETFTRAFVLKKVETSISIFGSRDFGFGTHECNVEVPKSLLHTLKSEALKLKKELEEELETL